MDIDLIKPRALAAEWQLTEKTLANWRSQGTGPPFLKISGGVVRYSRAAVAAWLEAQQADAHSA